MSTGIEAIISASCADSEKQDVVLKGLQGGLLDDIRGVEVRATTAVMIGYEIRE